MMICLSLYRYRKPVHEEMKGYRQYKHGRNSLLDVEAAVGYGGLTVKELQNEEKLSLITAAEQDMLKDWGETVL